MPRKFNKDRYITDDSFTVPINSLTRTIRYHLEALAEGLSIDWDDEATAIPLKDYVGEFGNREQFESLKAKLGPMDDEDTPRVVMRGYGGGLRLSDESLVRRIRRRIGQVEKAYTKERYSYLIEGVGPSGEEVFYFNKQFAGGNPQTFVYIDGQRNKLGDIRYEAQRGSDEMVEDPFGEPDQLKEDWQ